MNNTTNISARIILLLGFSSILFAGYSLKKDSQKNYVFVEDERKPLEPIPEAIDSPDLKYPYVGTDDPNSPRKSLIGLDNPLNVKRKIRYNAKTGRYEFISTLGDSNSLNNPISMSLEEFRKYQEQKAQEDYWKNKIAEDNSANSGSFAPEIAKKNREFGDICEGKLIDINPQGSAELRFGLNTTRTDNPAIPVQQRQLTTFDFGQQIQLNIQGSICDKFNLNFNYNTEATFDFENQTKLAYEGTEDQILQKIEAGNVTYPIQNTLIQGSQSLFGVRTDLKFGKLNISTVVSQNRGERKEINIKNGAQQKEFELPINNYEANRHYFLNHYHRDNYDRAMSSLPNVSSQIRITRMEVWVTNRVNDFDDTRNVVAFSDLGETRVLEGNPQVLSSVNGVPDNGANNLYNYLTTTSGTRNLTTISATLNAQNASPGPFIQSQHYERLENARLLSVSEYNYNSILGYISLNQPLNNDEILGVAYQYTYQGKTYQVGEFSTDGVKGNDVLFLKMLKGTINSPRFKVWDLMMKNIYSIGAYQINQENFRMDVWYNNPKTGVEINYIPQPGVDNKLALQLIGADIINQQQQPFPDGVFDFIPLQFNGNRVENGGTINPQNGRIIFSKIEPFGPYLEQQLLAAGLTPTVVNTIAFPQLYDSTQTIALQYPELNRFMLRGTYESANSSEISLNAFNIPQGSVTVTAGGVRLVENQDYTVDYNIGRVKILNDGVLNSGTPIKISLESNSLFTAVQKTMIGTHFDYRFNRDFNLGATMLRLSERPLTQKVNIGDEPVRNTMLGINGNFQREAPWLTRLVDNIPFINTKEKSSITASLEAAYLIPGHNPAIGDEGQSFIDDFEGSQSAIDIRSFNTWVLASIPQGQPDLFPEAQLIDNLDFGKNRALFNWNVYDPSVFYEERGLVPSYIDSDPIQDNHQMRLVEESELFPNRSIDPTAGQIDRIAMFNLAFFPNERGPYNYDTDPSINSAGLNNNGELNAPQTRWGGIMRQLQTNDFENANIEYIQFWVMDPFSDASTNGSNEDATNTTGGELYINLGNVSEDILRDGIKTFENGLTTDGVFDASVLTTTSWGRVPTTQQILTAFDNNPATRQFQDVGLDGLSNSQEQTFYDDYVNWVNASSLSPAAKARLLADPSGDDYRFYRDDQYDNNTANIIDRYKRFNGLEGNSATDEQSQTLNAEGYPTSKTTIPDLEDINRDNNLNETEAYYQYKMNLKPAEMEVGKNYIVDKVTRTHQASGKQVDWYQFRVPVRQPSKIINGINDFRSIRFMRIFMRGFQDPIILRFARLELLRGTWRRYDRDITDNGEYIQNDPSGSIFNISAVNIEENSSREPIDYTLPPNFQREINPNSAVQAFLNEQSLEMELCGLRDGIARAAFRNVEFDVLNYKKIKMFVHGEQHTITNDPVKDDDVTIFVRIGTDFEFNYYEYEMPIKMTQYGAVSPEDVWPEENNLEIVLEDLKNLKIARNNSGVGASILSIFEQAVPGKPDHVIKVIGNPNLQDLKTIMIGVRNPNKDKDHPWQPDDGQDKCVKVWVNELRMTDFENSGGWAAQSRVQATLADFATVSLAGQISTPGFGGIEQRVSERQRETIRQVDAATSIQLGKFFGPNAGVQFPLFIGFSEGVIDPQFDPLNPDIEFDRSIEDASIEEQQQRIRDARDITVRRSLNFTNVRIAPKKKSQKNFPWDIQNFAFTYAYSELYRRDIQTQYNVARVYNGGLNYTYQTKNKPFTPFKNNKFLRSSPWFKLIRDINIDPLPKQFAFNTNMDRTYNESKARDITGNALIIPQFTKTFTWDRNYDLNWNLMQGLRINFNANNQAFIEEPGNLKVDKNLYPDEFQQNRDSVLSSLGNFGENNHYLQNANVTYTWPLKKIPALSFVNLTTKYQATYDWQRAPLSQDSLGNTIQNSRNIAWNGSFNMQQLYNKVPYFKKVNQKSRNRARSTSRTSRTRTSSKKGEGEDDDEDDKKKKKKDKNSLTLGDGLAKIIMSLQNVTFSYSTIDGQLLPGYSPPSEFLGMTNAFSTPGVGFVFGGEQERDFFGRQTNNDFARTASENGWLVGPTSKFINAQRTTNHSKNFNTRFTFEPFKGVRVELTANYLSSENMNENFIWSDSLNDYANFNTLRTGNVSYSFNSIRTAFIRNDSLGNSPLFQELLDNRIKASEILNARNSDYTDQRIDTTGYYDGYGGGQSQVVLASFMAAYSGKELTAKTLNPLSALPNLNWRVTIDGLNRLPSIRKIFRSIVFTHAYNSTFTVANFNTDLEAVIDPNGNSTNRDASGNIRSEQQILSVAITEQFNPLFKVDATWQNSLITKFEYRSNRNISLSLTNNRITELKGTEITIGTGYRFQNVKFPIKIGKKTPISDINARLDFSLRDNKTIIRNIDQEQNQVTAGQRYIAIKGSADYVLNKQFTLRFYYDRVMTTPAISTAFPTMNQNFGFAVRVNLFQ